MTFNPYPVYESHRPAFDNYLERLLKWNRKINLTAITNPSEVVERHFLDSLMMLPLLPPPASPGMALLDIGSGGGFPGIPLKIVRPDLQVVLVDSVRKKCDFMNEVIRSLDLKNCQALHLRLEEDAPSTVGTFDVMTSRAALSLRSLVQITRHLFRPEGRMIAFKGADIEEEKEEAQRWMTANNLALSLSTRSYELPSLRQKRHFVIIG